MTEDTIDYLQESSLENVYFTPLEYTAGIGGLMAGVQPSPIMQPVRFGGFATEPANIEEFRDSTLHSLAEVLRTPSKARFMISTRGGMWFGSGLGNYYRAFENVVERYERDQGQMAESPDSVEAGAVWGRLEDGGDIVFTHNANTPESASRKLTKLADIDWNHHPCSDLKIALFTDGYPLSTDRYFEIGDRFGLDLRQETMYDARHRKVQYLLNRRVPIQETITRSVGRDTMVEEAIVENPFYGEESAIRRGQPNVVRTDDRVEFHENQQWPKVLAGAKYLPVQVSKLEQEFTADVINVTDVWVHYRLWSGGEIECTIQAQGNPADSR